MTVLGMISTAVSIIFGVYITRGITQPVKELEKAARDMVNGEFSSVQIKYQSGDELGKLAGDMRNMVDSLAEMIRDETYLLDEMSNGNFNVHSGREDLYVGEMGDILLSLRKINSRLSGTLLRINQSANEVALGSEQTSSGTQILAQGATEQAASVEEVSGTINEISDQIYRNAKSAKEASDKSQIVKSSAKKSSRYMQEMLGAMSNINEKSGEIRKIIKTIEDITFQTNILALNAAVEAARAGERGKGFTAVANEIRNLANQSTEASKSTAGLIESSLQAVEDGKRIAGETARALAEASGGIDNVSELLRNITDESLKQSDAIRQITESIGNISGVIQTSSATAQESAAASEELSSQAQLLNQLVSQFILKEEI